MTVDVSLVIPVYNNRSSLKKLYHETSSLLNQENFTFEFIFINDFSADDSLQVLNDLNKSSSSIIVINMKHNIGQHKSIFHGLRYVNGDCCVILDADLQDRPESVIKLLQSRSGKYEVIFAGREGKYQNSIRMLTSKIYKSIINKVCGLPKNAGVFMLVEKDLIEKVLLLRVRTVWINVMIGLASNLLHVIPVKRNYRINGVSSYTSFKRLKSGVAGLYCALSYYTFPLKTAYLDSIKTDPILSVSSSKKEPIT